MLDQKQTEIVNGSLLGDGCIWTDFSGHYKFQVGQSQDDHSGADKYSYLYWYAKEFCVYGCSIRPKITQPTGLLKALGKKTEYRQYVFNTISNDLWRQLEAKWYVPRADHHWFKRRKIVPQDLRLTPLTLCVWHMDDGSINPKDANIELNTQGFTTEEVDFLIERLDKDLGIKSHKKKASKPGQWKIYVGRDSYFDFIDMIKPHIEWDCFQYKIDTSQYVKTPQIGEDHSLSKLTEVQARQIFALREKGWAIKKIAKKFKVSQSAVTMILNGDRWRHLGITTVGIRKPRITTEQKLQIVELSKSGRTQKDIGGLVGVNQATVCRLLKQNTT